MKSNFVILNNATNDFVFFFNGKITKLYIGKITEVWIGKLMLTAVHACHHSILELLS